MTSLFLTSLTHPRKSLLVVLQIGKAKDLSAPLRRAYAIVEVTKDSAFEAEIYFPNDFVFIFKSFFFLIYFFQNFWKGSYA
jgi:hypothetical protein